MSVVFDHLAVAAPRLEDGVAHVEAALGVPLAPGGRHPAFGTHNRLLSLGPGEYLEVIAVDPHAPPPGRARWFDLDRFAGPPRLTNWIAQVDDLPAALSKAPTSTGEIMDLERGAYRWRMAVPGDGRLPFDGCHPALISWQGPHPADGLPDAGCRLVGLTVSHPRADALSATLAVADPRITFETGAPGLSAEIATPSGTVYL